MSLRSFHIVFIVAALGMSLFLAVWSLRRALGAGDFENFAVAGAALAALCAGFPYLYWFLSSGHGEERRRGISKGNAPGTDRP